MGLFKISWKCYVKTFTEDYCYGVTKKKGIAIFPPVDQYPFILVLSYLNNV